MGELDEMLDRIRAEGRLESSGAFTVDWISAVSRLERILADPHLYLLKLVQAGVSGSAVAIGVHTRGARLAIHYLGPPWAEESLREQASGGVQRMTRSLSYLFEGLRAALQLAPRHLTLLTWDGSGGTRYELAGRKQEAVAMRSCPFPTSVPQSVVILDRRRLWFANVFPELALLKARAGYSTVPLHIDGARWWGRFGAPARVSFWSALLGAPAVTAYIPGKYGKITRSRRFPPGHHVYAGRIPRGPGDHVRELVGRRPRSEAHQLENTLGKLSDFELSSTVLEPQAPLESDAAAVLGEVGIRCDLRLADNLVYFINDGVVMEPVHLGLRQPGIEALISGTGLPTDLTGLRLRSTPALAERLESVSYLGSKLWALQYERFPAATRDLSVAFGLLDAGAGLRVPL